MPRQLHPTPETPAIFMNAEIARFTRAIALPADVKQVPNTDESQHIPFLKALCQAFQTKALGYYNASPDATTRLQRLAEISQTFREFHFVAAAQDFTTAAENAHLTAEAAYATGGEGCPEGTSCIDRNCIPNGGRRG